jgi:hypothetical protein
LFKIFGGFCFSVFVGVGNQMGKSEYYKVYVKFGNTSRLIFDGSKPSSLPPLYEYQFFVGADRVWESPVTFGFRNVSVKEGVLSVDDAVINGMVFPVDASTSWDSENSGFYFRLSFELWRYDPVLKSFTFHNRVVGLQLNMTGS